MADTSRLARSSALAPTAGEVVVGLLGAAVVSIAVNSLIALLAGKFIPAGTERMGLALAEYAPATMIGIALGTLGWYLVRRSARDPRRVLRVLVPVVVVLSWISDLGILAGGASVVNSLALIAMHAVVAAATVPVLSRVLPLGTRGPAGQGKTWPICATSTTLPGVEPLISLSFLKTEFPFGTTDAGARRTQW